MNTLPQTPSAEAVIATLRAHEAGLRQVGIMSLSVFGSVARGDGDAGSDVHQMGRLDPAARIDLVALTGLERRLTQLLGRRVDLVPEPIEGLGCAAISSGTAGLPSERHDPVDVLPDRVDKAARIAGYVQGIGKPTSQACGRTRDAVERCLERICEAVFRLRDAAEALMPGHSWGDIREMGNRLRHAYDRISLDIVWAAVDDRFPALVADAQAAADRLRPLAD